jgi:uncharacterized protein YndB with AHSA1/START domain
MTMGTKAGTIMIGAPIERVFDYVAVPRNLIMANNPGPVIEQSEPATGPGSWAVLKFDQLRLRIEYDTWERPRRLAAALRWSGLGSGNRVGRFAFEFESLAGGTLVRYQRDGGPSAPLPIIGTWLERRYWQGVDRRLRSSAT